VLCNSSSLIKRPGLGPTILGALCSSKWVWLQFAASHLETQLAQLQVFEPLQLTAAHTKLVRLSFAE